MENPRYKRRYGYHSAYSNISAKLYKIVSETFSNVAADMEEEVRARNIMYSMRESDSWKTISAGFQDEKSALDSMYSELNRREAEAMELLLQQNLNEVGITSFKACGYGIKRIDVT